MSEDALEPDPAFLQISGQNYALISVVSPSSNQKNDLCGVKIRGVFNTIDEAKQQAKKIQSCDPTFDVFLVELYKWLPIPPDVDMIENKEYQDDVLNTLIKEHKNEQFRAKEFFEQRKTEMMNDKTANVQEVFEATEATVEATVEESAAEATVEESAAEATVEATVEAAAEATVEVAEATVEAVEAKQKWADMVDDEEV